MQKTAQRQQGQQEIAANLYSFKETENNRWGIYLEDRLLATVGSYEACESIGRSLTKNLSREDLLKITMTYKNSMNKSLIVG